MNKAVKLLLSIFSAIIIYGITLSGIFIERKFVLTGGESCAIVMTSVIISMAIIISNTFMWDNEK